MANSAKANWFKEKANEEYDAAKHKSGEAREGIGNRVVEKSEKRQQMADNLNWVKEKAKEGHNAAKNKAEDTLESAKEKIALKQGGWGRRGDITRKGSEGKRDIPLMSGMCFYLRGSITSDRSH